MERNSYWGRSFARQVPRRWLLRSIAAGGFGLAAAALMGCGSRPKAGASGGSAGEGAASRITPGGELRALTTADPYDFDETYAGQSVPNT
ncbi:MAG: hypothetical protein ACHQ50_18165, partial [Fimbriimonadales bacterium]